MKSPAALIALTHPPAVRLAAAALAAACALATPSAAQAPGPSPFDLFRSVCVNTGAEKARVLAAPEIRGWTSLPLPMAPRIENGRILETTLRMKTEGERMTVVVVSRGEINAKGRKVPFVNCSVAAKPGDLAQAKSRIQAWLGFAPMDLPKGVTGFHYSERNGVRTPLRVAKLTDLPPQPAGTRLVAISLKLDKGVLAISYTLPRL